jgi:hypothetical protein
MKMIVAIPLMLVILLSGINLQIASHFCRGNYSGSKVSLDGRLASCGMEDQSGKHSSEDLIATHCCDDVISSLSISPNYITSSCPDLPDPRQERIHISFIQSELLVSNEISLSLASGYVWPPGTFNPKGVEQQVLCIFRI